MQEVITKAGGLHQQPPLARPARGSPSQLTVFLHQLRARTQRVWPCIQATVTMTTPRVAQLPSRDPGPHPPPPAPAPRLPRFTTSPCGQARGRRGQDRTEGRPSRLATRPGRDGNARGCGGGRRLRPGRAGLGRGAGRAAGSPRARRRRRREEEAGEGERERRAGLTSLLGARDASPPRRAEPPLPRSPPAHASLPQRR